MSKYMKILVPFDNSPSSLRALSKAIALANISNGSITLIHVISYHKAVAKIVGPYKGRLITHVTKFLRDAQKYASHLDTDTDVKILHGSPAEEILKFIKSKKFDVIIMGKTGTSKLTGPNLGSVSNALV
ncbi:Universal stress protein [Marine Group I thaumarchaeote SCGC AAA799-E16]|uniref:Universal stress protein n=4 Tax=Marine Group I TaxID=905826 RepID=A0A087S992_9ARCH|nr:Universal stress protein [Marine Group I thaumarchaeote SCGC AAA799-N04]KER06511.1 Universal stress protein [Marine Group I thaumarchaeote SCGC AAA799-E16]KFM18443.1 Universal stress protein [Marine Group I thaumarchaeote SCGC RSA3]KFM22296.1 Universal stress protein [Marine Group I thaumarchaeote SCGC AAA799-B03]